MFGPKKQQHRVLAQGTPAASRTVAVAAVSWLPPGAKEASGLAGTGAGRGSTSEAELEALKGRGDEEGSSASPSGKVTFES